MLEVTSNIEYDMMFPQEVDWITIDLETRSTEMVKKEFHIRVEWNTGEEERQAELLVKQKEGSSNLISYEPYVKSHRPI